MATSTVLPKLRRWDASFSDDMSEEVVDRLMTVAPFNGMNPDSFPKHLPLRGILRHDSRVRRYRAGEIVVRQGDYGNSAFLILSGTVRVVLKPELPSSMLGRSETRKKSFFRTIAQLWSNPTQPEVRKGLERATAGNLDARQDTTGEVRVFLQDIPRLLGKYQTATIEAGEFFGEISALGRIPRTASIFCEEQAELLEIRWQGLRDIMRYDAGLKDHVDRIYRERALATHLRSLKLFQHLDDEALAKVSAETQFVTFGDYEWSGEYKRLLKSGSKAAAEPVILKEGDYANGVLLIRAGFARISQRFGNGQRTSTYLGAGQSYGLDEITHNWKKTVDLQPFQSTVSALGYTHALIIPTSTMEQVVLPTVPTKELALFLSSTARKNKPVEELAAPSAAADPAIGQDMMEFLAENRFFNGTKTMLIDLEACTRCDDCVRACAATHEHNPRFLRHGPINGNVMVANACMHCADPVCLIGCPTGAIHRNAAEGEVVINQVTCIGCQVCSNNCPYEAIRMVQIRNEKGTLLVDEQMKPLLKATKCDLCLEQHGGPACERACPHGALVRMNMRDLDTFSLWLKR
jgi:Fe-S-cluster-containing dehydrogenase component/CRP-like cAMP-binding protein